MNLQSFYSGVEHEDNLSMHLSRAYLMSATYQVPPNLSCPSLRRNRYVYMYVWLLSSYQYFSILLKYFIFKRLFIIHIINVTGKSTKGETRRLFTTKSLHHSCPVGRISGKLLINHDVCVCVCVCIIVCFYVHLYVYMYNI